MKRALEIITGHLEGRPNKVQKSNFIDSLDVFSQMMFAPMGRRLLGLLESGNIDLVSRFIELGQQDDTLNMKMIRELLLRRRPFSNAKYPEKAHFFELPSNELYDGWHPLEIKPVLLPRRHQKQLSRAILSSNESDVNFNTEVRLLSPPVSLD